MYTCLPTQETNMKILIMGTGGVGVTMAVCWRNREMK